MILLENILRKLCKVSIFLFFAFYIGCCDTYAVQTPFITEAVSESEKNKLIEFYKIKPISANSVSGERIECFFVSPDGEKICVGFSNGKVAVYSSEGEFMYGVSYFDYGGICCLFDEVDQELIIYSIRNRDLIKINEKGIVLQVVAVSENDDNQRYENALLSYEQKVLDKTYLLRFSKLSVREGDKEKVFLDHSREVSYQGIAYIIVIFFLGLIGMLMNKEYRNK